MTTRTCSLCQNTIPFESIFCLYCGSELSKEKPIKIVKILEKLKNEKPTENLLFDLSDECRKNWHVIKDKQLLTHYLIDTIREVKLPSDPNYLVHRLGGDSRSGGIFEDAFGQLFERYLQSDLEFWSEEKKFQLEIRINDSIPIPNEKRKKKPDIIVYDIRTNEPLLIIELKVSYSKRSLKKYYYREEELYQRLSHHLEYYFILFNASELKSSTYKKTVQNCRVVCYDFKTDKDSLIKRIHPKIIDPIEEIFEELKNVLRRNYIQGYTARDGN